MKKTLLTLALALVQIVTFGQAPAIQWQKIFGGDLPQEIQNTSDGGCVFIAKTGTFNTDATGAHPDSYDIWVVKLNALGTIVWQKCLGGVKYEEGNSIKQTADGGYIIAGSTLSDELAGFHNQGSGCYDIWVVKLNASGVIEWQKVLGGSSCDYAKSIQQTTDGGYVLVGDVGSNDGDIVSDRKSYYTNAWVVKLTVTGDIQWQKLLGGTYLDHGRSILQTADGGYLIGCTAYSVDGDVTKLLTDADYWIVKLNSTGGIEWQKAYGGTGDEKLSRISKTSDGGFIAVGTTNSSDGNVTGLHGTANGYYDIWVIKIGATGILEWQKTLGGTNDDNGGSLKEATSILQTKDGGYLVGGDTSSNDGDVSGNHSNVGANSRDVWLVKLNSVGVIKWQKCFGGSSDEYNNCLVQTKDNGFLLLGTAASSNGDLPSNKDYTKSIWIVKLAPEVLANTGFENNNMTVYPNPAKNQINLQFPNQVTVDKIVITDLTGKVILTQTTNTTQVNVAPLSNGMYILEAFSGEEKYSSKFIKE
jgi:hypothetical protein